MNNAADIMIELSYVPLIYTLRFSLLHMNAKLLDYWNDHCTNIIDNILYMIVDQKNLINSVLYDVKVYIDRNPTPGGCQIPMSLSCVKVPDMCVQFSRLCLQTSQGTHQDWFILSRNHFNSYHSQVLRSIFSFGKFLCRFSPSKMCNYNKKWITAPWGIFWPSATAWHLCKRVLFKL